MQNFDGDNFDVYDGFQIGSQNLTHQIIKWYSIHRCMMKTVIIHHNIFHHIFDPLSNFCAIQYSYVPNKIVFKFLTTCLAMYTIDITCTLLLSTVSLHYWMYNSKMSTKIPSLEKFASLHILTSMSSRVFLLNLR